MIHYPVYVLAKDSGEIQIFDSLQKMQTEFEEIDIVNDEYEAWDHLGVKLKLKAQNPIWLILSNEDSPADLSNLESKIAAFAASAAVNLSLEEIKADKQKCIVAIRESQKMKGLLNRILLFIMLRLKGKGKKGET